MTSKGAPGPKLVFGKMHKERVLVQPTNLVVLIFLIRALSFGPGLAARRQIMADGWASEAQVDIDEHSVPEARFKSNLDDMDEWDMEQASRKHGSPRYDSNLSAYWARGYQ